MRLRRLVPITTLCAGVTMSAAVAAPVAAYADTPALAPCAPLPSYVDGRPAHLHVRASTGDYLWHDSAGWHLRVTHPTRNRVVFRGVITASSPITFQRVRDEKRDRVALSSDKRTLTFRFVNYGGIDGVDFTDNCASTTRYAFALDGHRLSRNRIYIGAHSARPPHDPFVISRQVAQPAA
jgi:hypothetical protein